MPVQNPKKTRIKTRTIKMLLLQCPKCKNKMKYQPQQASLANKKKRCVYCGFSISVAKNTAGTIA